jgi:hypothetical protein
VLAGGIQLRGGGVPGLRCSLLPDPWLSVSITSITEWYDMVVSRIMVGTVYVGGDLDGRAIRTSFFVGAMYMER